MPYATRSHRSCAAARLKALDGIDKAVRQRLKTVLCIDLPVLSTSYSKSGVFVACTYVRPRYDGAGVEGEPIADQHAVIDGGHSSSRRFIQPSTRVSGGSTRAKKLPVVTASADGLVVAHVTSRMQQMAASGDKTRAAAIIHRADTLPFAPNAHEPRILVRRDGRPEVHTKGVQEERETNDTDECARWSPRHRHYEALWVALRHGLL